MDNSQAYPNFRWFVLLAMIASTAASLVVMIAPAPLIGEVAKSLNLSPGAATGIIMGLWNIIGATSCLGAGFLVDRYGINKLLMIGCVLLFIPSLCYPLVGNHLGAVIGLRIVTALGVGPVTSIIGSLAATWFPTGRGHLLRCAHRLHRIPLHFRPYPQLAVRDGLDVHLPPGGLRALRRHPLRPQAPGLP